MKSAEEWIREQGEHFEMQCDECHNVIRAIQADALEAAAKDLERSLMFDEANAPGGLGVPSQEQKWVDSIRRLKPKER